MLDREYLLACSYCDEYTMLHRYLEKEGRFQGEYSLLHNRFTEDNQLLCRFLLSHVGHPVRLIPNRTDEYSSVLSQFRHFRTNDLDLFVEEAKFREREGERDRDFERGLGQLQLLIIKKLLIDERDKLAATPGSGQDAQFLLGKQLGVEWALRTIDEIMAKGGNGAA